MLVRIQQQMGKWPGLNNDCYYFQVLSSVQAFSQSELRVNPKNPMRRLADDNDCYSLWRKLKCGLHNSVCRIWPIVWFSHPTHLTFHWKSKPRFDNWSQPLFNSRQIKDFSLYLHNDHLCKMLNPPIPDPASDLSYVRRLCVVIMVIIIAKWKIAAREPMEEADIPGSYALDN